MKTRIGILFAAALLGAAATASAATYYVSPGTQATQTGSKATPFATLDQAFAAAGTWTVGDVVQVGKGAYLPSVSLNVPAGVTLRGGYPGGWGANAWTVSNPDLYATAVTYNASTVVNLAKGSVLDGFYIFKTSGNWAVSMNDVGARVKNSTLKISYGGIYSSASGVTVESSKILQEGNPCCDWWSSNIRVAGGAMTIQNNIINPHYSNALIIDNDSRVIVRGNQFLGNQNGPWFWYFILAYSGSADIYQNLFDGKDRSNGTAISFNWNNQPSIVENNNITGVYEAYSSSSYQEAWGWEYPQVFRNNVLWANSESPTDSYAIDYEYYPYAWSTMQGNCIDDTPIYLYSYNGMEMYGVGVDPLNQALDEQVSGNIRLTAPPATPTSSACGGKGMTGVLRKSKPIAHGYATDPVSGQTYRSDIAVGLGVQVTLNGRDNGWNGSYTESQQFEGGDLTYTWSRLSGPSPVTVYSTGNVGEVKTGALNAAGHYVFSLTVQNKNIGGDQVVSDPFLVNVWVGNTVTVLTPVGGTRGTYAHLQEAIDAAQPGDTVQLPAGIFKPGEDYSLDNAYIYALHNLTIKGAGSGAGGTLFYMNCQDTAFDIEYSQNITVRDIAFTDAQDCEYEGIYVYESTGMLIDNVKFSGRDLDPWHYEWFIDTEYSYTTIQNSAFEWLEYPIYIEYGKVNVLNNTFTAIYDTAVYVDYMDDYGNDALNVSNNTFDMRWANSDWDGVIYLYSLYYKGPFIIQNNKFSNSYYYSFITADYIEEGTPLVIDGNTMFNDRRWYPGDNQSYGIYFDWYVNATITNNIISGMGYSGIYVNNPCCSGPQEVGVEGNVIVYNGYEGSGYYGIENYGENSGIYTAWARKNLVYSNGGEITLCAAI